MSIISYTPKRILHDRYNLIGFISSGTYGQVYKAESRIGIPGLFAVKKFKPEKDGDPQYTGISQSAIREMSLCRELSHVNVIHTVEILLQDKSIYIIFEYAEHDLLKMYLYHSTKANASPAMPAKTIKSVLYQLLSGLLYLHRNWVLHRDLKPANIMVTSRGQVRIGDLGLARLFRQPLQPLFSGDKVVVTIWYRAPELLLGSRHYTPAIDLWAVGCIFAELLALRPIFKGEEIKGDAKKPSPFQRHQMQRVAEILGLPTRDTWPLLTSMPEFAQLAPVQLALQRAASSSSSSSSKAPETLRRWYSATAQAQGYGTVGKPGCQFGPEGLALLQALFEYDPVQRLTAEQALTHKFFQTESTDVNWTNCLDGIGFEYPPRVTQVDASDSRLSSVAPSKRAAAALGVVEASARPSKRQKE